MYIQQGILKTLRLGASGLLRHDGAQDTVNKSGGVIATEGLSQLHCLVYSSPWRDIVRQKNLVYRQPQYVALHRWELLYRPCRRISTDHIIYLLFFLFNPSNDVHGK